MRYLLLLVLFLAQTLVVGCGQSTYDERLKANVDNPSRMSARNPPEEEEVPIEDEEWTAEELEAEEKAAAAARAAEQQ